MSVKTKNHLLPSIEGYIGRAWGAVTAHLANGQKIKPVAPGGPLGRFWALRGCSGEVASSDAASKTQLKSAALPEAPTEI